jgi:hypothetical protein
MAVWSEVVARYRSETPRVRRVVALLLANLALAALLSVLMVVFRGQLLGYELAHLPRGVDPALFRRQQGAQLVQRAISTLVVTIVYAVTIRRLLRGERRAYRRVLWISVAGLFGLVVLLVTAHYPVWMRVEQVVQMGVLVALLWAVTRPEVRARFAKPRAPAPDR